MRARRIAMTNDLAGFLQLADSAFPSGAFAQSFGLETAIAAGRIRDEAMLERWLAAYLLDGLATFDGAAIVLHLRDGAAIEELDEELGAATFAEESRQAAGRLARTTLDAYAAMGLASPELAGYRSAIAVRRCAGHVALAFALGARAAAIGWESAFIGYASSTLAVLGSCAARAVPLGQRTIARTRWRLRATIDEALARAAQLRAPCELHAQAFSQELDAMNHALLEERLFSS
jgi:urease accessory protein